MERLEELVSLLDQSLNTRPRRHIAGGILMSISFFFGGLAITIMTLSTEENESE